MTGSYCFTVYTHGPALNEHQPTSLVIAVPCCRSNITSPLTTRHWTHASALPHSLIAADVQRYRTQLAAYKEAHPELAAAKEAAKQVGMSLEYTREQP